MKISHQIAAVKRASTTTKTLRRYLEGIDEAELSELLNEYAECGEMSKELQQTIDLVIAIAAHQNADEVLFVEDNSIKYFLNRHWPIEKVFELAKSIKDVEALKELYVALKDNKYAWSSRDWETVRAILQTKPGSYGERFANLQYIGPEYC